MQKINHICVANLVDRCAQLASEGCVVISQTKRLRHLIRDSYNQLQVEGGAQCWPSPDIFTWDGWLRRIWEALMLENVENLPQLLTKNQQEALWEACIVEGVRRVSEEDYEFLLWRVNATAATAMEAYAIMRNYQIESDEYGRFVSADAKNYLSWLKDYRSNLQENNYIDSESLPELLGKYPERILKLGRRLVLAGFDELLPQQQSFLEDLLSQGAEIQLLFVAESEVDDSPTRIDFASTDEEITQCAKWARTVVEEDPERNKVGIVVPDLRVNAKKIRRLFSAIVNPNLYMEDRQPQNLSFHSTLGGLLSELPVVADALNLIMLVRREVETETLRQVIVSERTKYWGEEASARARLADRLFFECRESTTIENALKLINRDFKQELPQLRKIFKQAESIRANAQHKEEFGYWARFFSRWIQCFQATSRSDRNYGQEELVAHQQWGDVVNQLSELGIFARKVSVGEAIAKLLRVTMSKDFQPRNRRVPIQIGGTVALSGQKFTHLWIMGMNNESFPGPARPNPFIPISIQKERKVRNASPILIREAVERRIAALIDSSETVILSYARTNGDQLFEPSSLLQKLGGLKASTVATNNYSNFQQVIAEQRGQLVSYCDWRAPKVDPASIRRGVSLLSNQSQCPFKAFVSHRLDPPDEELADIGFSAIDRGAAVHGVLETLYEEYPTHAKLVAAETKYIEDARILMREALTKLNEDRLIPVREDVFENEVERLTAHIQRWYGVEGNRVGFEVLFKEKKVTTQIAGFEVRGIVDRVDKIAGGYVVIDYKTGNARVAHFTEDRIKESQLLVYAKALKEEGYNVQQLAYAVIRRDGSMFRAHPQQNLKTPESKISFWDDFMAASQEKLEQLGKSYLQGDARVDPAKGACEYCPATAICRTSEFTDA